MESKGTTVEDAQHRHGQKGEELTPLSVPLKLADSDRGLAMVLMLHHQDLDN